MKTILNTKPVKIHLSVNWRRITAGIEWSARCDDWKIHLPILTIIFWFGGGL